MEDHNQLLKDGLKRLIDAASFVIKECKSDNARQRRALQRLSEAIKEANNLLTETVD